MLNKTFNEYELRLKKEVAFFKNLISSENFLNGHFKLNGYLTTNKVDIAIDLYELEYHANNDYYIYGDLIQKVEYSSFIPYYDNNDYDSKISEIWNIIDEEIWGHVNFTISEKGLDLGNINEFIYIDFINIISYKASGKEINGQDKDFLEKQIEVYQNGGFPCGWKGYYPEGKMVVFIPN